MNSRVSGLLGICRKANKMSMGHDACKGAVTSGKAKLCLLSSESSQRIYDEFARFAVRTQFLFSESA